MAHGMGDMVAWESHDVSTKKTQEWRQEQVLGSHAPARPGWTFPQGTVALFRSPSRLSEPTGRTPCHLGMRTEQERTGLSMSPCSRRQRAGAGCKGRQGSRDTARYSGHALGSRSDQRVLCQVQSAATGAPRVRVIQHRGKCTLREGTPTVHSEGMKSRRWRTSEATSKMQAHRMLLPQGRDRMADDTWFLLFLFLLVFLLL